MYIQLFSGLIMARKKSEKETTKSVMYPLRMTAQEHQWLRVRAREKGTSMSNVIRTALDGQPLRDYGKEEDLWKEFQSWKGPLTFVANNLNQLTRAIHEIRQFRRFEDGEFSQLPKELEEAKRVVAGLSAILYQFKKEES